MNVMDDDQHGREAAQNIHPGEGGCSWEEDLEQFGIADLQPARSTSRSSRTRAQARRTAASPGRANGVSTSGLQPLAVIVDVEPLGQP